jgi:hypothetical protein
LARHLGQKVGVVGRDQPVEQVSPYAGKAPGEAVDLERHDQAHDIVGQRRADARGMGQDQAPLQLEHLIGGDGLAREQPKAGVDAIDHLALGKNLGHAGRRPLDRFGADRIEVDVRSRQA